MGRLEYNVIWDSLNQTKNPYMSIHMLRQATGLSIPIILHTLEDKKYRNSFVKVFPGIYKLKSTPTIEPLELALPIIMTLQHKQMFLDTIASAAKKDRTLVCAIVTKSAAKKYFVKIKTVGGHDLYGCSQEGLIILEEQLKSKV